MKIENFVIILYLLWFSYKLMFREGYESLYNKIISIILSISLFGTSIIYFWSLNNIYLLIPILPMMFYIQSLTENKKNNKLKSKKVKSN